MEDDRDILGKADALLRRHAPHRAGAAEGTDVPVLTELITPGAPPPAPVAAGPTPHREGTTPSREAFTRELVAGIVDTVQARIAQDLERTLATHVTAEVHAAVAAAVANLRQDIAAAVGDAVAEALARRPHP